jgi:hypothetical protein
MRHAEAPARVEASLLAAFRAKAAAADKAGAGANVVPLAAPRRWSWVRTAAAASFAAAAALAFFVLFRPDVPAPAPAQSAKGGVRPMIEPPPGALGVPAAATLAQTTSPDGEEPETLAPAPGFKPRIPRAPLAAARPRAANISYGAGGARAVAAQNAPAQEIATDFIQLAEAGPYSQAEEAHLVRVELPRSALANFGLPVNAETAGGRVKADVLLGQDGVARAIRFVR